MSKGFFSNISVVRRIPLSLVPKCGACGLYKGCISPKMQPSGKGKKRILIVAEAPGKTEDERGKQLVGESGRLLEGDLEEVGINMRRDCWLTNALICRPPDNIIKDKKTIDYCRPNLIKTIDTLKPEVIILLGGTAVKSLLEWVWKEDVGSVSRWLGWRIPNQKLNTWICPTWHPSFLLRGDRDKGQNNQVARMQFKKHLKEAVKLQGRPWKEIPDYRKEITTELDIKKVVGILQLMIKRGRPISFDFETDRLKPDARNSTIISCAVSDGKITVSYPWMGRNISKTCELLKSSVPKIGFNLKFEDRWCRSVLDFPVNNWVWDGMIAAHILDNRPHITGLKFQSFVLLGVDSYDDVIRPYMKSDNSNTPNQMKEVELNKLLIYNGMDALLEYKVAEIQSKQLGIDIWSK